MAKKFWICKIFYDYKVFAFNLYVCFDMCVRSGNKFVRSFLHLLFQDSLQVLKNRFYFRLEEELCVESENYSDHKFSYW